MVLTKSCLQFRTLNSDYNRFDVYLVIAYEWNENNVLIKTIKIDFSTITIGF